MTDPLADFIDHLRSYGIGPENAHDIIADDKRRRYRIAGDKPKTLTGSYQLHIEPDGFAVGWGRSFREGVTHAWHSKTNRKASAEDREAWKRKQAEAKTIRDAEALRIAKIAKDRAKRLWQAASTSGTTPYLSNKTCGLHGARIASERVLVPLYDAGGIVGLQFIGPDGSKRFLTGTPKLGAYFPIVTPGTPPEVIVICEGFATGAAIRESTGWAVVVAFDAGNLKPVAVAMRRKFPEARIIIGADNDQWTHKPDGAAYNPGLDGAHAAALAIGGAQVISPVIPSDDPDRRTDWDDVWRSEGQDAVHAAFTTPPAPVIDMPDYGDPGDYDPPDDTPDRDPAQVEQAALSLVRPLGHNTSGYVFFPRGKGLIVTLSASALSKIQSLYMLAPREFWDRHYGGAKVSDGQICAFASAHLMEACHKAGIFQPDSTRGVGAWVDGGKVIINCGNVIVGPDVRVHPAEFDGEAIYEAGPPVIQLGADPLQNADAAKLRDICGRLVWKHARFGDMLAGWLVVAPIGSALHWRPHIAVVGRAGSGKTTVVNEVIAPVLGAIKLRTEGATEAGVRRELGSSGRPYMLDEAESETTAQRIEMEKIIQLIRKASSGGTVSNFHGRTQIRSCFCLSAINTRIVQEADKVRISELELMPDTSAKARTNYNAWLNDAQELLTPDFSKRLFARTVANIDTLLANVKTFENAAADIFGNQRHAQQIAPLVAGAYMLTTTKTITPKAASDWLNAQDWSWHTEKGEGGDAQKLLTIIMTSRIRYDVGGIAREQTVADMIEATQGTDQIAGAAAEKGLRSYGIKIEDAKLVIANNSPQLRKVLADTVYTNWGRTLSDYPGADKMGNKVHRFGAIVSKATGIPLDGLLSDGVDAHDIDLPLDSSDPDTWR